MRIIQTFLKYLLTLHIAWMTLTYPLVALGADYSELSFFGPGIVTLAAEQGSFQDPESYFAGREGEWTYLISYGVGVGSEVTEKLVKVELNNTALWRRLRDGGHSTDFILTADGVSKTSLTDPAHRYLISYNPGEAEILGGMRQNETRQLSYTAIVSSSDNPGNVVSTGKLSMGFTYMGFFNVKSADTTYLAAGFQKILTGNIGPTTIDTSLYVFYAKNIGEVARIDHTDIHAFLLYNQDSRTAYVLSKPSPN